MKTEQQVREETLREVLAIVSERLDRKISVQVELNDLLNDPELSADERRAIRIQEDFEIGSASALSLLQWDLECLLERTCD